MDHSKAKTLNFYSQNANQFIANTRHTDFSQTQNRFLAHVVSGGHILDWGCGSGRDAKAFLDHGYIVTAMDGTPEICKQASQYLGQKVIHELFEDLDDEEIYDGIWACASLLHVQKEQLPELFEKAVRALKPGGVFYASFKYGEFEGMRNGRWFTDLNEESAQKLISSIKGLKIEEMWQTYDVRPGREKEIWLNLIMRKTG